MIVAEIHITACGFADRQMVHTVRFSDLAKARSEYERVASLMKDRADRKNDRPSTIEVNGDTGSQVSLPLDSLAGVGLCNFELSNAQLNGVKDAFPHLFKA